MDKLKLFILNNKKIILYSIIILILVLVLFIINDKSNLEENNYENEIIENNNDNENEIIEINNIEEIENKISDNKIEPIIEKYIYIDIKGEIKKPNVYKVKESDNKRVIDIINLAGGLTKNAYTNNINMSLKVYDEMVIIISSIEEVKIKEEVKKTEENLNDSLIREEIKENKLININTDPIEKILEIPGIGESKAQEIIQYRKDNNGFKTIDEIKNISGIGEKTFEKLKDYITV